jgi:hypothetical protein
VEATAEGGEGVLLVQPPRLVLSVLEAHEFLVPLFADKPEVLPRVVVEVHQ